MTSIQSGHASERAQPTSTLLGAYPAAAPRTKKTADTHDACSVSPRSHSSYGATGTSTELPAPELVRSEALVRAPSLRQQRLVSASLFSLFGYMFGHFSSQLPVTKSRLEINDARFGMLLLADDVGNFVAQGAATRFPRTLQSSRWAPLTGAAVMSAAGLANLSRTQPQFGASLGAMGAACSLFDIAINIQLVALGKASGEPEASFFHGLFSAAQLLGGAVGAALTKAKVSFEPRVALTAMTLTSASLLHWPFVSRQSPNEEETRPRTPSEDRQKTNAIRTVAAIGLLSSIGEGALSEWAGIYLKQDLHTDFALANSAAFACALGMTASRFAGSQMAKQFGVKPTLVGGGAVAATAVAVGLINNQAIPFLIAIGVAGAGLANMTPLTMTTLTHLPDDEQAAAVTKVSIAQQVGFFAGPPLIGAVSGVAGLRYALGLISVTSVAIGLASMFLRLEALAPHNEVEA